MSDGQSKKASLLEAISNTLIGYLINIWVQVLVFPWFGIEVTMDQNVMIGGIFLLTSVIRGYILRRTFNYFKGMQL